MILCLNLPDVSGITISTVSKWGVVYLFIYIYIYTVHVLVEIRDGGAWIFHAGTRLMSQLKT